MVESFKRALGLTPGWARVLAVAPVPCCVAGCAQVGGPSITFWDIIWSMSVFFLWLIFIWMFVALFIDVIRRKDLSGWKKAGWIIFMLILPFLGILLYVAMRPATASDVWAQSGGYSDPYGYGGGGAVAAAAAAGPRSTRSRGSSSSAPRAPSRTPSSSSSRRTRSRLPDRATPTRPREPSGFRGRF